VSGISAALRQFVVQRARHVCEYCGLSQEGQEATFHVDHVVPRAAGGQTVAENLALACVSCSLRKAARQIAVDPHSGHDVPCIIHGKMSGMSTSSGIAFLWSV
jgi:5-methylcytosine-specific restriction endonuclease McrA